MHELNKALEAVESAYSVVNLLSTLQHVEENYPMVSIIEEYNEELLSIDLSDLPNFANSAPISLPAFTSDGLRVWSYDDACLLVGDLSLPLSTWTCIDRN